jgi:hypothetical protein
LEVVEIANPATAPADASGSSKGDQIGGDRLPATGTSSENQDDSQEEDTEFTVAGSCLGKNQSGVIWYDKRKKEVKQNRSMHCKNNRFEFKIKAKKSILPYIEVQSVFFN